MTTKNSTATTLIGLLTGLAIVLVALILTDSRGTTQVSRNISSPASLVDNATPNGIQMASMDASTNPVETLPNHISAKRERVDANLVSLNSSSGGNPTSNIEHQTSRQHLYDKLSDLTSQNRDEEALETLKKIIRENPDDVQARMMLAELYYRNDNLTQSIVLWKGILEIDPFNEKARARLAKARRENKTHQEFTHEVTRHFRIKFEGSENRDLYKTVLDQLEEAYGEVGKALSYYPDEEIIVFLYTNKQFFDVTRAPAWTGGVFDGKIRIPTGGYQDHLERLRHVLFHEYVHAVVHLITDRTISRAGNRTYSVVPTWFHEGIAQYLEPDKPQKGLDRHLRSWVKKGAFLELPMLHGSFMGFNNQIAGLAYGESLSAVKFMVDEFGLYSLKRFLNALGQEKTVDEAMRDAIFISYEDFQSRWENHLRS